MRKILIVLAFSFLNMVAHGQWIDTGNTTYTNDNIGIGTSNLDPLSKVTIDTDKSYPLVIKSSHLHGSRFKMNANSQGGQEYEIGSSGVNAVNELGAGNFFIRNSSIDFTPFIFASKGYQGKIHIKSFYDKSSTINLKNDFGTWHMSGPRSQETGHPLSIYYVSPAGVWKRCFHIRNNGRIGIGTTNPSHKLHVNGGVRANNFYTSSDERYKSDINDIENAGQVLKKISGKSYLFKTSEFDSLDFETGKQFGVIAQELESVLPELVNTDENGYKSVNYIGIIPFLIEAIKEDKVLIDKQNKILEDQMLLMENMALRISKLETFMKKDPSKQAADNDSEIELFQNQPNPAFGSTVINYRIPFYHESVQLRIMDMGGRIIERYDINDNEGIISVDTNRYNAGMYVYSIYVKGEQRTSKKMLVTK